MITETESRLKAAANGASDPDGFTVGALAAISDMLVDKEKAVNFSANATMIVDGVLLGVVREKHRWQKS